MNKSIQDKLRDDADYEDENAGSQYLSQLERAAADKIDKLENALRYVLATIPMHDSDSGFVIDVCDYDGNYIETKYADPVAIIMEIISIVEDSLTTPVQDEMHSNIQYISNEIENTPRGFIKLPSKPRSYNLMKDKLRMDWLESKCVEVRQPLFHGSLALFHAQQVSDDCDEYKTNLRQAIDDAMLVK